VTVQTKSELPPRACREYEQRHFKVAGREARESGRPNLAISLRQIVAKIQSKPALKYRRRLSRFAPFTTAMAADFLWHADIAARS
jgi:hypothetical protein